MMTMMTMMMMKIMMMMQVTTIATTTGPLSEVYFPSVIVCSINQIRKSLFRVSFSCSIVIVIMSFFMLLLLLLLLLLYIFPLCHRLLNQPDQKVPLSGEFFSCCCYFSKLILPGSRGGEGSFFSCYYYSYSSKLILPYYCYFSKLILPGSRSGEGRRHSTALGNFLLRSKPTTE